MISRTPADPRDVPCQIADPDLDLDRAEALLDAALQRGPVRRRVDDAEAVVGRHRFRLPAEQLDHRPPLARAPACPTSAMSRPDSAMPTIPWRPIRRKRAASSSYNTRRARSRAPPHDLVQVIEKRLQRPQRERGVPEDIGPADRPLLRGDVHQQERRDRDVARRGAQRPRQRRGDGARVSARMVRADSGMTGSVTVVVRSALAHRPRHRGPGRRWRMPAAIRPTRNPEAALRTRGSAEPLQARHPVSRSAGGGRRRRCRPPTPIMIGGVQGRLTHGRPVRRRTARADDTPGTERRSTQAGDGVRPPFATAPPRSTAPKDRFRPVGGRLASSGVATFRALREARP